MNIKDKHTLNLPISEELLFESEVGITSAFQILEGVQINNQIIRVPAMLICIAGKIIFQDENGTNKKLFPGDFINIEPMVKHLVRGLSNSQLIVIK